MKRRHIILTSFAAWTSICLPLALSQGGGGEGGLLKGEVSWSDRLGRSSLVGMEMRMHYFINANQISGEIYNYGSISPGTGLIRHVNNMVWHGIGNVFEFGPLAGASVINGEGKTLHIVSEGLSRGSGGTGGDGDPISGLPWGWEPLPGYADPQTDLPRDKRLMASSGAPDNDKDGKPDTWPREWYNPLIGKYVWPGYLSQNAENADLEVFWGMDDRDNAEFPYYPFPDTTRKGLGLKVEGRALQWSNPLAEDAIFFVYTIQNVSPKNLDTLIFGMYGDIDIGGGCPTDCGEPTDDWAFFIRPDSLQVPLHQRSIVFFWDPDNKGHLGLPTSYTACKFLESPGNESDGKDNDGDGMIDESQTNGIDDDKDWNPVTDDVGIDGVADAIFPDFGEGDGLPTAGKRQADGTVDPLYPGEPNFELTDLDESDQIGLTSFNSWAWSTDWPYNDESMWKRLQPGNFTQITENSDIVFIYGSGRISLKPGDVKRFSISVLYGEDLSDLLLNAESVQRIYDANYRFFKPPEKPTVSAVPGDKRIRLYWNSDAEKSVDPLSKQKDFEGYVIYRSADPLFSDITKITDGKGTSFLNQPLLDGNGDEAKYDLADGWKGFSVVPYVGRGVRYYLGSDRGIVHSYVDSVNVVNGQKYYYAVVAYDHGDSIGIPPTETTKRIIVDPILGTETFDKNTIAVVAGPRSGGYMPPSFTDEQQAVHVRGMGTGQVFLKIVNDLEVKDNRKYALLFKDTMKTEVGLVVRKNYSILDTDPHSRTFEAYDTNFVSLASENLLPGSVVVKSLVGDTTFVESQDYTVEYTRGLIKRRSNSKMATRGTYAITYQHYPVYQSTFLSSQDGNPIFDGLEIRVRDTSLAVDTLKTRWIQGNSNLRATVKPATVGSGKNPFPADYRIEFSSTNIDSAYFSPGKKIPVKYSIKIVTERDTLLYNTKVQTYLVEKTATKDSSWSPGEEIAFFAPGSLTQTNWGVVFDTAGVSGTRILPTSGDVFYIGTTRQFTKADRFEFTTRAARFDASLAKSQLDKIYVVPNPYVVVNSIEPTTRLPGQTRGERRIYFENLPKEATIRIFTLSGELVNTLHHSSTIENGREYWNLLNRDNIGIAYGIYFAHIEAPGVGEKVVRFAVIK